MKIKDKLKQNISLIVGLSIPVFMILFVAASIYLPRIFMNIPEPQFDLIYTVDYFQYSYYYWVEDGKLKRKEIETTIDYPVPPLRENISGNDILYFHDVSENTSREITFEDTQELVLSSSSFSPDGFEITRGRSGGGLFMPGPYDYHTRYLKKGVFFQKLDLNIGEDDYYNFKFIGWVIK